MLNFEWVDVVGVAKILFEKLLVNAHLPFLLDEILAREEIKTFRLHRLKELFLFVSKEVVNWLLVLLLSACTKTFLH